MGGVHKEDLQKNVCCSHKIRSYVGLVLEPFFKVGICISDLKMFRCYSYFGLVFSIAMGGAFREGKRGAAKNVCCSYKVLSYFGRVLSIVWGGTQGGAAKEWSHM